MAKPLPPGQSPILMNLLGQRKPPVADPQSPLEHALKLVTIANDRDNFSAQKDDEFDYLKRAEEFVTNANKYRSDAAVVRGQVVPGKVKPSTVDVTVHQSKQQRRPQHQQKKNRQNISDFRRFVNAISGQESGGNYGAVNPDSGAAGKYQIMPGNFVGEGGWDQQALGRDITLRQYLRHPRLQEKIARHKLKEYFKNYGPAGAASAWYSGSPDNFNSRTQQGAYPSIHEYVMDVLRRAGLL